MTQMKPLPQFIDDLRTLAVFMHEQADSIAQLCEFFGGPPSAATTTTARPRPAAPPPPPPPPPPAPQPVVREQLPVVRELRAEPEVPEAPAHKERKQPVTGARPLSPDEKASIRKDWESFPKMLRTAENRRALASKYRCSNQQVFALVREDGHLLLLARKAAEKKHAESLTGAATR